jgi:hypothetical protein
LKKLTLSALGKVNAFNSYRFQIFDKSRLSKVYLVNDDPCSTIMWNMGIANFTVDKKIFMKTIGGRLTG